MVQVVEGKKKPMALIQKKDAIAWSDGIFKYLMIKISGCFFKNFFLQN